MCTLLGIFVHVPCIHTQTSAGVLHKSRVWLFLPFKLCTLPDPSESVELFLSISNTLSDANLQHGQHYVINKVSHCDIMAFTFSNAQNDDTNASASEADLFQRIYVNVVLTALRMTRTTVETTKPCLTTWGKKTAWSAGFKAGDTSSH